jgi:SAM-dependent methyltransferase
MKKQDWFSTWFDTNYYHILYQHRSYKEAESFIANLLNHLEPSSHAHILDLACGKGRHSYFMAQRGFEVTGLDLSIESIIWARENYTLPNLLFDDHDMRKVYKLNEFDYIFNFFTSFGYFNSDEENHEVIQAISKALKNNGTIVIDFMNAKKTLNELNKDEVIVLDNIKFNITRVHKLGFIIKTIKFNDEGKAHEYFEKVQALVLSDFQKLFDRNNLHLVSCFGDYQLNPFNETLSDRLIMVVKKNA